MLSISFDFTLRYAMPDFLGGIFAGGLAIAALLAYLARVYLKALAEKAVAHQLDKRLEAHKIELQRELETHKASLQSTADSVKFDFQRQMRDVELFAAKRHEVSAQLYFKIRRADGAIRGLFGARSEQPFAEMDDTELLEILEKHKVTSAMRRKLMESLQANRQAGLHDFRIVIRRIEVGAASTKWHSARNYCLVNEIYTTDDVERTATDVLELLLKILIEAEMLSVAIAGSALTDRDSVTPKLEALRVAIRSELGRGYSGKLSGRRLSGASDAAGDQLESTAPKSTDRASLPS